MIGRLKVWAARNALRRLLDAEECVGCGWPVALGQPDYWHVTPAMWRSVYRHDRRTRCPRCFAEDAAECGIRIQWKAHPA